MALTFEPLRPSVRRCALVICASTGTREVNSLIVGNRPAELFALLPCCGMTAAIAMYAALVATAALALQLVSEWRSWATRVEVSVSRMKLARPDAAPEPVILFRLINHSGHQVKVTHLSMDPVRRGGQHTLFPQPLPLAQAGPFTIPPRDAVTVYQPPNLGADADLDHKTRAAVATSDGASSRA
jgi:hypothetical protein